MTPDQEFIMALIKSELDREKHSMECLGYDISNNRVDLDMARAMLDNHWELLVKLNSAVKWLESR